MKSFPHPVLTKEEAGAALDTAVTIVHYTRTSARTIPA